MPSYKIQVDDPRSPEVRSIIEQHLSLMAEVTPPGDIHALDLDGLLDPSVTLFSLRREGVLLGIGALQMLDPHHVELKSMHTVAEGRRQGLGRAMLDHLLSVAKERGVRRVSLETGSQQGFAAAIAFYRDAGFRMCEAFGKYQRGTTSIFMTIQLD